MAKRANIKMAGYFCFVFIGAKVEILKLLNDAYELNGTNS